MKNTLTKTMYVLLALFVVPAIAMIVVLILTAVVSALPYLLALSACLWALKTLVSKLSSKPAVTTCVVAKSLRIGTRA